jgi:hypothetical protein
MNNLDFLEGLVVSLTERLLAIEYPLGKKNFFFVDGAVDHQIYDIFCDHLASRSSYSEVVSELLSTEAERDAFDRQLKDRVYDALYVAHGGLS